MTIQLLSYSLIISLVVSPCLAMQDQKQQKDCLICFKEFTNIDHLISCSSKHQHTYHDTCILTWIKHMHIDGASCCFCQKNNISFTAGDIEKMDRNTLNNLAKKEIIPSHYFQPSMFDRISRYSNDILGFIIVLTTVISMVSMQK